MLELSFQILGPTTATRHGRPLDLGSPKQRAMLVALLLEPGRVIPLRRLQSLLWEDPPVSATANTRTYASGLRKVLGPVLQARDGGYLLDVEPAAGDLGRFTAEVAAARQARSEGDLSSAEQHFERAIAMWRGECGEDLPADIPLRRLLIAVTDRRIVVLEELADLRLRRGPDPGLASELRDALVDHPAREGLWARLMRALAAIGDTAGALEAYKAAREELAARLGVDPGPELEALQRSILSRDPSVMAVDNAFDSAVENSRHHTPHELPVRPQVFLGRDLPVARLVAAATEGRADRPVVLAVDGPGGIGKSALAIEVAHLLAKQHPDGEVYLDLQGGRAGLRAAVPAEVLSRLLRSCGEIHPPDDLDGLAARWRSLTHERRLLVVLDNVLDPEQVSPLLPNAPGCTVIITSRKRLTTIDVTVRLSLSTLDPEQSVEILRTHAEADPSDGMRRIADLCGGLPLALRMAAARLAARTDLSVEAFAERLADDRFRLNELGHGDAGVRATFMTSYAALTDSADPIDRDAAHLFCLLGSLPMSGCSVGGAYALIDALPDHGDACVGRLVELQLVACDGVRLRLHDLLRLFAREVADTADVEGAMHRAAWYYAESAQRAWRAIRNLNDRPLPRGPLSRAQPAVFESRADALRWLAAMAPSLRELVFAMPALPDVPTGLGAQIVRVLVAYDGIAGSFRETIDVARCLVDWAAARHDPQAELVGHRLIAVNLQRLRRAAEARAAVAPAIALLPEVDDIAEKMNTLNTFGIFQTEWGDYEPAEHCLQSGLELARKVDDRSWLSIILHSLGMHYRVRGQLGRCIELLRESLSIRQELDDAIGETYTRMQLGKALPAIGEFDEGMTQLDIALGLAEHLESIELVREIRMDRMEVLATTGRIDTAAGELRAALDACSHLDDEALTAEVLQEAKRLRVRG